MEVKTSYLDDEDWASLQETADTILKNASRDLILWTHVKNEVVNQRTKCQALNTSKEEKKSTK